jgi:hypothetical protein
MRTDLSLGLRGAGVTCTSVLSPDTQVLQWHGAVCLISRAFHCGQVVRDWSSAWNDWFESCPASSTSRSAGNRTSNMSPPVARQQLGGIAGWGVGHGAESAGSWVGEAHALVDGVAALADEPVVAAAEE